jgi:membrane-bound lytic murein transglycosylase D
MSLNFIKNKQPSFSASHMTLPLTISLGLLAAVLFFYCINTSIAQPIRRANHNASWQQRNNVPASVKSSASLWDRMRRQLNLFDAKHAHHHPQVTRYMREYSQQKATMRQMSSRAKPYLYYIVERVEAKGMPLELALLPMLESQFRPNARSPRGANGLWQIMPGTGRQLGLKQRAGYDGRRDVAASTEAALNYLSTLHRQFNHDWMLALAAYNAGPGAVQRAVRKNKQMGRPTDFWSLSLPKETKAYVPKLIALTRLIKLADQYDLDLTHIHNAPHTKK